MVQKGTLTEEEASQVSRMVTSALVYMHRKNIIHRDLKPENLLLTRPPVTSKDIEVKIIDFGLSKVRKYKIKYGCISMYDVLNSLFSFSIFKMIHRVVPHKMNK